MDAATLYVVLTIPNGEQSTSTQKFPTLEACEAQAEWLRQLDRLDHQLPSTSYRCEGHNRFAFVAGYGKSRRYLKLPSRQACTALNGSPTCTTEAPENSATVSRIPRRFTALGGSEAWTQPRST